MVLNKLKIRKDLIQELEKNYLLQPACSKLGLTRSTVYRWMKDDQEFDQSVKMAQSVGIKYMSDYTESKLFKNIENQEQRAIEFFLRNNNERYKVRDRAADRTINNLNQQLRETQAALANAGPNRLYTRFLNVEKVEEYFESPEYRKREMLRKGIYKESNLQDKEIMNQVRKIIAQVKFAEFIQSENILPEENDELAD